MTPEASRHRRRIGGLLISGRLPLDYVPETRPMDIPPEPQAASINATAKLWAVYSGEYTSDDGSEHWGAFWEPLSVTLGESARPHCCYANQIAFYDRTGNKLLKDFVQHYGFTASLHPHLLFLAGKWREVVNGRCEYRNGRWHMRWGVATNTHWAMKLNGHLGA